MVTYDGFLTLKDAESLFRFFLSDPPFDIINDRAPPVRAKFLAATDKNFYYLRRKNSDRLGQVGLKDIVGLIIVHWGMGIEAPGHQVIDTRPEIVGDPFEHIFFIAGEAVV